MKRPLLFFMCSFGMASMLAGETYLSCDFENGIPSSFSLYDRDGNEPSIDTKKVGFEVGTPWVTVMTDKDSNTAACSTSWYKVVGQSDDWMVTPKFEVTDETAIMRWRSMASDKDYRDGYSVYISETGITPECFDTSLPVFSTKAEKAEWTDHEISLASYVGKNIAVAFVNDSRDKAYLYVDDIFAGIPTALEITSSMPRVIATEGEFYIEGSVKNTTSESIKDFSVEYSFNGGETYTHKEYATIRAGKEYVFRFPSKVKINANETLSYALTVNSEGETSTAYGKLSCYRRAVVAEEITGTWCGYCVRGIAAMAQMKEDYGDDFIGIAAHAGSEAWPDPMEMKDYNNWLFNQFNMSGYPNCTVNRSMTTTGDPANIPYYVSIYANQENYYGLDLIAEVNANTRTVKAHTDLYTAKDLEEANMRLAYAVVENNVHSEESVYWSQSNYYSGGGMGEMGGFESLPEIVPAADMWYQDVARYFSDNFEGIEGSLPAAIHEDEVVSHEYSFTLPGNILNDSNTELIVLLLNSKNGTILNGKKISLADSFSGVESVETFADIDIKHFGETLCVNAESPLTAVEVYAADGKIVERLYNQGCDVKLNTAGMHGVYIVKASTENSSTVKKFIF